MKRPALLIALILLVLVLALLGHGPGPRALDEWRNQLVQLRLDHPVALWVLGLVLYTLVTALSLPVALWMTLAAGLIFGFVQGVLLVSVGATLGATLAFCLTRAVLRDWVRARYGHRLRAIDRGVKRDGALYLFSLRLVPVVPFFMVNMLMALTAIPLELFSAVSFLGMLPATLVYVNAGTQLGRVHEMGEILSPPILLSFAALALFPWVARAVMRGLQRRRTYGRWVRPRAFDRNLVVIGAGAAGLVAAYMAAAVRAKVTLVEQADMGGDCLTTGCVPSKALIRAARAAKEVQRAGAFGVRAEPPRIDWPAVMSHVQAAITAIEPHDSAERYRGLGVEVTHGKARILDPWTVEIKDGDSPALRLTTRAIIIATGAEPAVPDLPGLAKVGYLTTESLWQALARRDHAPQRLAVLGGGVAGCELAQAFARLGSAVTLIEAAPNLLPREDEDLGAAARAALLEDGVRVLTGHKALSCDAAGDEKWLELEGGERLLFDDLLVVTGRAPRLHGIGLEDLDIPTGRFVETNDYLETLYPNILAAGDVAGPYQLTHAASHQAWYAAMNALFGGLWRMRADYRVMPQVTYLQPEIARVGLSEAEATAQGIRHEVTRLDLADLDRAITDGATDGFVKVLTVPGRDRILGVAIVADHGGELLAEFSLAMRKGLGLNALLSTVHPYPTLSEVSRHTAGAWRRAHVNAGLLRVLERFHRWKRGA